MPDIIASERQSWFNPETGILDRSIFTDEAIYRLELQRIFARAWNFICHESQLPETGSFFLNSIGEDEVIAVRDREGAIQVLLNTCPHRGNTVCRAEVGTTRSFFCSYHGWNFDLDGSLIGVPGEQDFYRDGLDKAAWGLTSAARVDNYRGFVFATLDPSAPPLEEFLGWVGRLGIDFIASQGDIEFVDGVQKNRLQCNWKLAVDNLYDWYHVKVSHGSAMKVGMVQAEQMAPMSQMVMLGEYGHGIGGPGISEAEQAEFDARQAGATGDAKWYDISAIRRQDPEMRRQLGPVGTRCFGHPNIFPNLWITLTRQVCLRIPRGPMETELWWFSYVPKHLSADARRRSIKLSNHLFGPAGMLEQDDAENWSHSTKGARGSFSKDLPLNYAMGRGLDQVQGDPSGQTRIDTVVNEHAQRWTYQSWQDWMRAENWEQLMAEHSTPPGDIV
jgi:phenylpropionate dioxygenase-like ring-hydroxylating dioxygenase large terminal subunit